MMSKVYVKKPVMIHALQWTGMNRAEIMNFCHDARFIYDENNPINVKLIIHTLEGDMYAKQGDYIIKGVRGEFYPCARDIFEETYEEVME